MLQYFGINKIIEFSKQEENVNLIKVFNCIDYPYRGQNVCLTNSLQRS